MVVLGAKKGRNALAVIRVGGGGGNKTQDQIEVGSFVEKKGGSRRGLDLNVRRGGEMGRRDLILVGEEEEV